jgi:hypothetical protein
MIKKVGELVQYLRAAAMEHGASPFSEVRVGPAGPMHRIQYVKGSADQRGFSMVLELDPVPESDG